VTRAIRAPPDQKVRQDRKVRPDRRGRLVERARLVRRVTRVTKAIKATQALLVHKVGRVILVLRDRWETLGRRAQRELDIPEPLDHKDILDLLDLLVPRERRDTRAQQAILDLLDHAVTREHPAHLDPRESQDLQVRKVGKDTRVLRDNKEIPEALDH
jgi:hypothetical protein